MQRQLEENEYQIKDWCVNAVNLAEYFMNNQYLAQAEYCLFAAQAILPIELSKKRKLRATIQMQLGKYYLEKLIFGVSAFLQQADANLEKANQCFYEFKELNLKWPIISALKDEDHAKTIFRLSNTQLKKASEFYVLDGYVTEHVIIKQTMSKLYKYLIPFEEEPLRVFAMT